MMRLRKAGELCGHGLERVAVPRVSVMIEDGFPADVAGQRSHLPEQSVDGLRVILKLHVVKDDIGLGHQRAQTVGVEPCVPGVHDASRACGIPNAHPEAGPVVFAMD